VTITVNGVEISLEFLPQLIDALDQALIIDKRQHVLRVTRSGADLRITDLTAQGFLTSAWNHKDPE
jgi:hypothetical protein